MLQHGDAEVGPQGVGVEGDHRVAHRLELSQRGAGSAVEGLGGCDGCAPVDRLDECGPLGLTGALSLGDGRVSGLGDPVEVNQAPGGEGGRGECCGQPDRAKHAAIARGPLANALNRRVLQYAHGALFEVSLNVGRQGCDRWIALVDVGGHCGHDDGVELLRNTAIVHRSGLGNVTRFDPLQD